LEPLLKRGTQVQVVDNFLASKLDSLRFPNLPNDLVEHSLWLIGGEIQDLEIAVKLVSG